MRDSIVLPAFTPESGHWVIVHKARKQDFASQFQALRDSLRDQFFELNEIRKQFSKLLSQTLFSRPSRITFKAP
jgi:hypothetical protein